MGESIIIDIEKSKISLEITETELKERKAGWQPLDKGVLAKYNKQVTSASLGAVTDFIEK